MGFWSGLKSFASGVANVVKKVASTVRGWLSDTSEKIGERESYNSSSSSVADTINISEILTEFTMKTRDQTDLIEEKVIDEIDDYFNDLEYEVQGKIDTSIFRSSLKDTKREIKGVLKKNISSKISIDNYDCREILEMPKGQSKTQRMAEFQKKVINEAVEELEKKLLKAIKNNERVLLNSVQSSIDAEEQKVIQAIQSAESALNEKMSGEQEDATSKIIPLMLLAQSEGVAKILAK